MNSLSAYWKEMDMETAPYIHPQDKKILEGSKIKFTINTNASLYDKTLHKSILQLGILPSPYMGDLDNSKIYIVMLNPGFGVAEYLEKDNLEFKAAKKDTILQDFSNKHLREYPYMYFHPDFAKTAGGEFLLGEGKKDKNRHGSRKQWLLKCLDSYIETNNTIQRDEAKKVFAKNICLINAFPYHSGDFKGIPFSKVKQSGSHQAAIDFIKTKVVDKSNLIFVARKVKYFKEILGESENIVYFDKPGESRPARFSCTGDLLNPGRGDVLVRHLINCG